MDIGFAGSVVSGQAAEFIGWTYAVTSLARIVAYAPQVALVRNCADGARSVSLTTWITATISHLAAAVYGVTVMPDPWLTAIGVGNAAGSGAIVVFALARRYPYAINRPSVPAASQHSADMPA